MNNLQKLIESAAPLPLKFEPDSEDDFAAVMDRDNNVVFLPEPADPTLQERDMTVKLMVHAANVLPELVGTADAFVTEYRAFREGKDCSIITLNSLAEGLGRIIAEAKNPTLTK